MKIAFFMQGKPTDPSLPHVSYVMQEVFDQISKAGVEIKLIVAESEIWNLANVKPEYDIYVLKSKSPLTLSIATILSDKGAICVNSVESCQIVRDKIVAEVLLAANCLPVPPAWTTGNVSRFKPLLEEGAIWIKERSGSKGRGVFRLDRKNNTKFEIVMTDRYGLPIPLFAQRDVTSPGNDLKVYVVGDRIWAIKRPWPATTSAEKKGKVAKLQNNVRDIAMACGKALGLEIFGVDFLVAEGQCHVVDVNAFPGFKGIGQAPQEISSYLLNYPYQ